MEKKNFAMIASRPHKFCVITTLRTGVNKIQHFIAQGIIPERDQIQFEDEAGFQCIIDILENPNDQKIQVKKFEHQTLFQPEKKN